MTLVELGAAAAVVVLPLGRDCLPVLGLVTVAVLSGMTSAFSEAYFFALWVVSRPPWIAFLGGETTGMCRRGMPSFCRPRSKIKLPAPCFRSLVFCFIYSTSFGHLQTELKSGQESARQKEKFCCCYKNHFVLFVACPI